MDIDSISFERFRLSPNFNNSTFEERSNLKSIHLQNSQLELSFDDFKLFLDTNRSIHFRCMGNRPECGLVKIVAEDGDSFSRETASQRSPHQTES